MSFTERLSLTVILNYFKILRACLNVSRALGPDPTKHETSSALVPKPACKPSASLSKPGSTAQCFRLCEALWLGCFTQEEKKKRRDKTCIWEYLQQLYNTSTILSWNQIALLLDFSFLKTKRRLFYKTETTLPKPLIGHWLNINTSESLPHFKIQRKLLSLYSNCLWTHKHSPHPNMALQVPATQVYLQPFAEL